MFYAPSSLAHAEARYQELLREAETERLLKHGRRPESGAAPRDALTRLLAFLTVKVQWQ